MFFFVECFLRTRRERESFSQPWRHQTGIVRKVICIQRNVAVNYTNERCILLPWLIADSSTNWNAAYGFGRVWWRCSVVADMDFKFVYVIFTVVFLFSCLISNCEGKKNCTKIVCCALLISTGSIGKETMNPSFASSFCYV